MRHSGKLPEVDWQQPWLAPYAGLGRQLAASVTDGVSVAAALTRHAGPSLSFEFVAAPVAKPGLPYETLIFTTRSIPTRDNLHDLFNGLCWSVFPQAKQRLNQLQADEIAATGVRTARGPLRDAITLFDENAALLQAPDMLWQALAARQWQRLFGELRPLWRHARLTLFGHALLEKLGRPYKSITAHVWRADPALQSLSELDAWLAQDLTPDKLARKPFATLPVLGVPGWCGANEDPAFYRDAEVFRGAAQSRKGHVPSDTKA